MIQVEFAKLVDDPHFTLNNFKIPDLGVKSTTKNITANENSFFAYNGAKVLNTSFQRITEKYNRFGLCL